jgi:hypothetical protein
MYFVFNRSYSDQANGMKLLDNLVDKLDNETNELKRLASETNLRIEELKTAVIQVNFNIVSFLLLILILSLDI